MGEAPIVLILFLIKLNIDKILYLKWLPSINILN